MLIDFSELKLDDLSPIYQQIVRYIKIQIITKNANCGDELPSRRVLSATLEVNPNTIQKAYRVMEEEGFLVSYAGSKSLLEFDTSLVEQFRHELPLSEACRYITEVKRMGLDMNEAKELITRNW